MLAGAALLAAAFTPAASADTLREALDQVYRSNPSLTGARAGLRALDEGVPQAKALGRPTFSVTTGLKQSFRGLGRLDSGGRSLRSDERRVGKGCVRTCRSRGSRYHYKK